MVGLDACLTAIFRSRLVKWSNGVVYAVGWALICNVALLTLYEKSLSNVALTRFIAAVIGASLGCLLAVDMGQGFLTLVGASAAAANQLAYILTQVPNEGSWGAKDWLIVVVFPVVAFVGYVQWRVQNYHGGGGAGGAAGDGGEARRTDPKPRIDAAGVLVSLDAEAGDGRPRRRADELPLPRPVRSAVSSFLGEQSDQEPEPDDVVIARSSRPFFSKETTDDPWERAFLLYYEPYRKDIGMASALEPRLRELVLELARLTNASTQTSGRVQTAMRQLAQEMVVSLHRLAVVVLQERGPVHVVLG